VWIAADPGGVDALRALIDERGLSAYATWMTSSVRDAASERALIAQAWDLDAVRVTHERFVERFTDVSATGDKAAFEVRTRLVHAWRATFEGDPRLPAELLPADWPGRAATEVFVATWRASSEAAGRWWAHLDRDPREA